MAGLTGMLQCFRGEESAEPRDGISFCIYMHVCIYAHGACAAAHAPLGGPVLASTDVSVCMLDFLNYVSFSCSAREGDPVPC